MGKIVSIKDFKARQAAREQAIAAEEAEYASLKKEPTKFYGKAGWGSVTLADANSTYASFFTQVAPYILETQMKLRRLLGMEMTRAMEQDIGKPTIDLTTSLDQSYHDIEPVMKVLDDIAYGRNGKYNPLPAKHRAETAQVTRDFWSELAKVTGKRDPETTAKLTCMAMFPKDGVAELNEFGQLLFFCYAGMTAHNEGLRDECKAMLFIETFTSLLRTDINKHHIRYSLFVQFGLSPQLLGSRERLLAYECDVEGKNGRGNVLNFITAGETAAQDPNDPRVVAGMIHNIKLCDHKLHKWKHIPLDQVLEHTRNWDRTGIKRK